MYSIVLMAAAGTGTAAPAADTPAAVVVPAAPVVVAGCTGCTGCTGYVVSSGCNGCYGSCHGGGLFHRKRGGCHGGGLFGHHNKSSCNGCYGGNSCTGYSCFGSYMGCQGGCYGAGYGWGYSYGYGGCCGGCYGYAGYNYGFSGYGCAGGGIYPSYSYPYSGAPAVVVPVETPVKKDETTKPADGTKKDDGAKKEGGSGAANLKFRLPAGAALYVDGRPTPGEGAERAFFTPALEPGQKYFYDVKAEFAVGGRTVTEDRRVVVQAGADLVVEFPKLMAAAAAADSALAGK
ncbi:MAG: TIGR03000 domain-containing protein [Gemmataceae bacterium]|nr:TIGR03000 domain-containing protein [Gemmataceae bacterium]